MSGRGAALRIARRDARRAPGRSLLIALMVAVPVAGAAFIDVVLRTVDVRGVELIPLELGDGADARLLPQPSGDPVLQQPTETYGYTPTSVASPLLPAPTTEPVGTVPPTDPGSVLPAGTRLITDQTAEVQVRTAAGLARTSFRELDLTDPLAAGLLTPVTGRAPRALDEVAVSPALLDVLGLDVGDAFQVTTPPARFTIVGTVRPASDAAGADLAVGLPGALLADASEELAYLGEVSYLVDTPGPVSWDQVLALNDRGVVVFSRAVVQDPPPDDQIPLLTDPGHVGTDTLDLAPVIAIVLVVGLTVVEVALLAGAAFAVGTRRQSRALGLLAATGGTSRQVRSVVLAQGLGLGLAGGLIGVATGTAAGVVLVSFADTWFDALLPAVDLRPVELLALAGIGVLTGLLAAVLPARVAARQDVVAALSGRRGTVRTRRRFPVLGLVGAGLGVAVTAGGGALALAQQQGEASSVGSSLAAGLILLGAVLTQVGLIVATPAVIGLAASLGRWLPLAPRLALRDASRHRGRSAPAVAAVLAAVAGSVALTVFVVAQSDRDRAQYQPALGYGQGLLNTTTVPGEVPRDAAAMVAAVSRVSPPDDTFEVAGFLGSDCTTVCTSVSVVEPVENRCPTDAVYARGAMPSPSELADSQDDPRCTSSYSSGRLSGPVVGGYDDLVRLTALESDAARRALEQGGMVVFDPLLVRDGRGLLEVTTYDESSGGMAATRTVELPATYVPTEGRGFLTGFVSPEAAAATGVPTGVEATVVEYAIPPDDDTEEAITAALAAFGERGEFTVERGYRDAYGIGLLALLLGSAVVTLGAAGIATGLAQADARADLATLAAIGAAPRLRRVLTAFQATVVAGLGALLGTVSGLVPALGYLYADPALEFVAPWRNLLVITVVVPVVAAVSAGLLTRSRLPLGRRVA